MNEIMQSADRLTELLRLQEESMKRILAILDNNHTENE